MTEFGPQLIGQIEKTLNAMLRDILASADLTEPQWVTLRLASQHDGAAPLADVVADRARFDDAAAIVAALRDRGLLDGDRLAPAGADLLGTLGARTEQLAAPLFAGFDPEDVAATERVLNLLLERARGTLAA